MSVRGREAYCVQSVENALLLLEVLSEAGGEASLAQLGERLDITKASLFRLLATFESRGYVERQRGSREYVLGPSAYELGQKVLGSMELLRQARPAMLELAREFNEAVYLVVRRGEKVLFLDVVDTVQRVRLVSQAGRRFALESSAPGRIFMAHDDKLSGLCSEDIRRSGFCADSQGICDEAFCAAVPVFDAVGDVIGVLAVLLPDFRVSRELLDLKLLPALKSAGGMISSRLGYLVPLLGGREISGEEEG